MDCPSARGRSPVTRKRYSETVGSESWIRHCHFGRPISHRRIHFRSAHTVRRSEQSVGEMDRAGFRALSPANQHGSGLDTGHWAELRIDLVAEKVEFLNRVQGAIVIIRKIQARDPALRPGNGG
jgi:hypothetical protein